VKPPLPAIKDIFNREDAKNAKNAKKSDFKNFAFFASSRWVLGLRLGCSAFIRVHLWLPVPVVSLTMC